MKCPRSVPGITNTKSVEVLCCYNIAHITLNQLNPIPLFYFPNLVRSVSR